MTKTKLGAGLIALALTVGITPVRAAQARDTYSDVSAGAWYAAPVEFCRRYGLMDAAGENTFDPEGLMTRATLAEALYRLEGRPALEPEVPEVEENPEVPEEEENPEIPEAEETENPEVLEEEENPEAEPDQKPEAPAGEELPFSDVGPDHPSLEAIRWAARAEVVNGYPDGTFRPDAPITREEIAVLLWNSQGQPILASPLDYVDGGDVSDWASSAVAWAQGAGIMVGDENGRFLPQDNTTRAQGASLLRGCGTRLYGLADATATPPASRPTTNNYIDEYFSVDPFGYLSYHGDVPCYRGIDVSSHQGEIDWARVAGAGIGFAMIRAGYRGYVTGSLNKDSYFEANIQGALANGLDVGVYFFSQAITPEEAEEEARLLLEWVKDYSITYPLVFDWEMPSDNARTRDVDGATVTACAQAFCKLISDAGYIPMTYGSPSKIYSGGLLLDQLQDYPAFWLAHYTRNTAPTSFRYHYEMWQYSSTGWVDGITGDVDLNICLTDWSQWYKNGG